MIVSEKGTRASWPLPREGIDRAGGSVDEVNTHGESAEAEKPFVKGRKSRRIVNMVPAQISLSVESYLGFSINIYFLRVRQYARNTRP